MSKAPFKSVDADIEALMVQLDKKDPPVSEQDLSLVMEHALWGFEQEMNFGRAYAFGLGSLIGETPPRKFNLYLEKVKEALLTGPTMGYFMATHLVPVLKSNDQDLLDRFLKTFETLSNKGTHLLKPSLETLSRLLEDSECNAARAYLNLLKDTFLKKLTYNKSVALAHQLSKAVIDCSPKKRLKTIRALQTVSKADVRFVTPYLEGWDKGLYLLSEEALSGFIEHALEKRIHGRRFCEKFLSLESRLGQEAFESRQMKVSLAQVRPVLNRYLHARTNGSLSVKSISSVPKVFLKSLHTPPLVCSDGRYVYLTEELGIYQSKERNTQLYKALTRLETGYHEFGTFDFDLQKLFARYETPFSGPAPHLAEESNMRHDLNRFFSLFSDVDLARDLFYIFEQGRIRLRTLEKYPGIIKKAGPFFFPEILKTYEFEPSPLSCLYGTIGWGMEPSVFNMEPAGVQTLINELNRGFINKMTGCPGPEISGKLVCDHFQELYAFFKNTGYADDDHRLGVPFGMCLMPDFFISSHAHFDNMSKRIKVKLEESGISVYKSDIRRRIIEQRGRLSAETIEEIVLMAHTKKNPVISGINLKQIFGEDMPELIPEQKEADNVFWYKEWNSDLQDYLKDHVRLVNRSIESDDNPFYESSLQHYYSLVKRVRYAFELMRPQGIKILKPWMEGDTFDYRALLDYAIDKKAGWLPSERLYIKRLKQQRDVAVLLLVDLSRSTANTVNGSDQSVLDVEKEAIVLLCEALEVLGDRLSIAGFSGTGRLGVDYYRIKNFDDSLNDSVKNRIGAMTPKRSTRMGAAIRHATKQLTDYPSKVRLLILLGDGFPNDSDYKREYAIDDTRKAVSEAFAQNIHFRAITVNMSGDALLDNLFGNMRHLVISDVRQLPDKLHRIYSAMTTL